MRIKTNTMLSNAMFVFPFVFLLALFFIETIPSAYATDPAALQDTLTVTVRIHCNG